MTVIYTELIDEQFTILNLVMDVPGQE